MKAVVANPEILCSHLISIAKTILDHAFFRTSQSFEFSSHLFNHIIHDWLLFQGTSKNKFEAGKTFVAGNTLEEIQVSLPLQKLPLISITSLLI